MDADCELGSAPTREFAFQRVLEPLRKDVECIDLMNVARS